MPDDIQIYVNNLDGDDRHQGKPETPVQTAGRAFSLLPPSWRGNAEIIFAPTGRPYDITTGAVSFGTPIGPDATPVVIRGGYEDLFTVTADQASDGNSVIVKASFAADELIGAVLTRLSGTGTPIDTAVSIRGNTTTGPTTEISLLQTIGRVEEGNRFKVQRPAVTLRPTRTLNLTSHDGRSPNCTLIGIKFAPEPGMALNLLNLRAHCDTCEFAIQSAGALVHTSARIQGGIEDPELSRNLPRGRGAAGAYVHAPAATTVFAAVRNGMLGGHLVFKDVTVRVSQGGVFVPRTLESLNAPIHILTGGSALGQPGSWGTRENKGRIRNVAGATADGLRIFNGGTLNSPGGPMNLDIFGCGRDGIRLDMGSTASFGSPGGESGLVTTGAPNGGFGMNVRNASRALIGGDAASADRLNGRRGEVTIDDDTTAEHHWRDVVVVAPLSNDGLSLVRVNR